MDKIAAQMTAGREWFLPGDTGTQEEALRRIVNQKLGPAVLARAAWWEQELRRELTMGLKQVLLLGAGLESLPCRQTAEMERMSFYEVDTPAVLAEKEKRLREVGSLTPRNVYRVGVDLAEDWEKTLLEMTPFATEQRTLTALLGVVYYLPRAAMEALLKRLAAITPRGSSLLFDCPMKGLWNWRGCGRAAAGAGEKRGGNDGAGLYPAGAGADAGAAWVSHLRGHGTAGDHGTILCGV